MNIKLLIKLNVEGLYTNAIDKSRFQEQEIRTVLADKLGLSFLL